MNVSSWLWKRLDFRVWSDPGVMEVALGRGGVSLGKEGHCSPLLFGCSFLITDTHDRETHRPIKLPSPGHLPWGANTRGLTASASSLLLQGWGPLPRTTGGGVMGGLGSPIVTPGAPQAGLPPLYHSQLCTQPARFPVGYLLVPPLWPHWKKHAGKETWLRRAGAGREHSWVWWERAMTQQEPGKKTKTKNEGGERSLESTFNFSSLFSSVRVKSLRGEKRGRWQSVSAFSAWVGDSTFQLPPGHLPPLSDATRQPVQARGPPVAPCLIPRSPDMCRLPATSQVVIYHLLILGHFLLHELL